jgi:hypothetical protein
MMQVSGHRDLLGQQVNNGRYLGYDTVWKDSGGNKIAERDC